MLPAQVVFATSEIYPFSKSGGLGDVMGALPLALHRMGIPTAVITPFYGKLRTADYGVHLTISNCHVGYPFPSISCDVYEADYHGIPIYFISRGEYYDRRHYYNSYTGDYFDNGERFIFFSRAVMALIRRLGIAPAIVHANDWQSALVPAYIHFQRQQDGFWRHTKSALTIHNLGYQGCFSAQLFEHSGLPQEAWSMNAAEFWGDFNLLKTGIAYADRVFTVSPTYAKEILSPAMGCGLEGILQQRASDLYGILNGVDYDIWSPEDDKFLSCAFSRETVEGKATCKRYLIEELGFDASLVQRPILGFIGRLREQKGIDIVLDIMPKLMELNIGVVILGEGDLDYEAKALSLMEDYRGRVVSVVSYTEDLAHRIQAGCDMFLMPSRYEPCGLTQMYALRYGTIPIATAAGGLRDTITPWPLPQSTGFTFGKPEPQFLLESIQKAVTLWSENASAWHHIVQRAMRQRFTWEHAAKEYAHHYEMMGLPMSAVE